MVIDRGRQHADRLRPLLPRGSSGSRGHGRPVHARSTPGDRAASSIASSRRPATRPWRRSRRPPSSTRTPTPPCCVSGSLVFQPSPGRFRLHDPTRGGPGFRAPVASPAGPAATSPDASEHPVTQVAYPGCARIRGMGRQAPADRGRVGDAARGGLVGKTFTWGDGRLRGGAAWRTTGRARSRGATRAPRADAGTSPVGSFPPNGSASTTWPATSGSGRRTSTRCVAPARPDRAPKPALLHAAAQPARRDPSAGYDFGNPGEIRAGC